MSQPLHSATGALLPNEGATEVREEPALHPEPYQRDVAGGIILPWNFPVVVVSKSCQKVFTVAKALRTRCSLLLGMGLYSSSIKGVYYDTLWLTFVERGPSDRSPYTELFGV